MHKFLILIILATMPSILVGCNKEDKSRDTSKIYPKENFSVIEGTLDNGISLVGSINLAYENYSRKENYVWCLKVYIALDTSNLYKNGLPLPEESQIAIQLEDVLMTEIKKLSVAHYIGHIFNDTFLDFYVYLNEPEKVHKYLQTQINKDGLIRGFGYEINQDPNWKTVKPFFNQ